MQHSLEKSKSVNRALDLFPGSVYENPLEFKRLEKMHGRFVYVELREGGNPCTLNSPKIYNSPLRDDSKDRQHFKAAFHVSCGLLDKKIYSTENKKITIGYKMLLCLGLVLLTVGNIQPRFPLVNRAVSSRELRGFVS